MTDRTKNQLAERGAQEKPSRDPVAPQHLESSQHPAPPRLPQEAPDQNATDRISMVRQALVMAEGQGLDDLTRQKIHQRLNVALDQLGRRGDHQPKSGSVFSWRWATAGVLMVLIVAGGLLYYLGSRPSTPATGPAGPRGLLPYVVTGPVTASWYQAVLGQRLHSLQIPPETSVLLAVKQRGRIRALGPASLAVTIMDAHQLELRLRGGLLLAQITPAPQRQLRIMAHGVVIHVRGTSFAVDARDPARLMVAVSKGAVTVDPDQGRNIPVVAGQSWQRHGALGPISSALAARLAQLHDAPPPPDGPSGTLLMLEPSSTLWAHLGSSLLGQLPLVALLSPGKDMLSLTHRPHGPRAKSWAVSIQPEQTTQIILPASLLTLSDAGPLATHDSPDDAATPGPLTTAAQTSPKRMPSGAGLLYARAEEAMSARNSRRAITRLEQLIARFPHDPLAATARYDLARLLHQQHELPRARAVLQALLTQQVDPSLKDPAHFLLCRLTLEAHQLDQAIACLTDFRRQYPASPHGSEALFTLAELQQQRGGCPAARALYQEYLRAYPQGRWATKAARQEAHCQPEK